MLVGRGEATAEGSGIGQYCAKQFDKGQSATRVNVKHSCAAAFLMSTLNL
jgi:hypothetical protein